MRRFFQAHRSEDYSQIQYLTAKCTRLVHDRAALERDFLLGRERERKLHHELQAARARLLGQERLTLELRARQEELLVTIQQQQELLDALQRRVVLLAEKSCRDEELLQQVGSELLSMQSSELRLVGLVEELHSEAQRGASLSEGLRSELHSKVVELQELQGTNETLTEELQCLRAAYQQKVSDVQRENQASVGKLRQTAEQCELLCRQQRHWMFYVRRFKQSLMEERGALLREVSVLQGIAGKTKLHGDDRVQSDSGTPWRHDQAEPEPQVEEPDAPRRELCDQVPAPAAAGGGEAASGLSET